MEQYSNNIVNNTITISIQKHNKNETTKTKIYNILNNSKNLNLTQSQQHIKLNNNKNL